MVRVEGLEPPCPCERWIFSPLRLPFRHTRCRILLIELPHQDGNRTSTHQCSAGSAWRLGHGPIGPRLADVDCRCIQGGLDVQGVNSLDHLDAGAAIPGNLVDIRPFHQAQADVGGLAVVALLETVEGAHRPRHALAVADAAPFRSALPRRCEQLADAGQVLAAPVEVAVLQQKARHAEHAGGLGLARICGEPQAAFGLGKGREARGVGAAFG